MSETKSSYTITVAIPEKVTLIFQHVTFLTERNNRFYFIDSKTGLEKDFPSAWCAKEVE